MEIKLNQRAFEHAKRLIDEGRVVIDQEDNWSGHQPSTAEENEYLRANGFGEYSKWYLAIDQSESPKTKQAYRLPYGDFQRVHLCALLAAESRAAHYKHQDIQEAAAQLHDMLAAVKAR